MKCSLKIFKKNSVFGDGNILRLKSLKHSLLIDGTGGGEGARHQLPIYPGQVTDGHFANTPLHKNTETTTTINAYQQNTYILYHITVVD